MSRERKDRAGNWIIDSHGISLLRLANISGFTAWQSSSDVLTFPKQMPDGLLDVTFPSRPGPDPFLIEIETFPNSDTAVQLRDDAAMVLLTRGVLPDILLVILSPKGNLDVEAEQFTQSAHGLSDLRLRIRVVKLWTIPAEELLATNDVGLIPWVPLCAYSGPPELLLQRLKERIELQADSTEKGNLLAATHVMAEVRYNDLDLFRFFGEQPMSMQKIFDASPTIQRIKAEAARSTTRQHIESFLQDKLGTLPDDVATHLRAIDDSNRLNQLLKLAAQCTNLDTFRSALREPQ